MSRPSARHLAFRSFRVPMRFWRRTTVENQQLTFGENGFCNNGPHTAGSSDSHQRGDSMDKQDDEIAHPLSYQFLESQHFQRFVDFAIDRLCTISQISRNSTMSCLPSRIVVSSALSGRFVRLVGIGADDSSPTALLPVLNGRTSTVRVSVRQTVEASLFWTLSSLKASLGLCAHGKGCVGLSLSSGTPSTQ